MIMWRSALLGIFLAGHVASFVNMPLSAGVRLFGTRGLPTRQLSSTFERTTDTSSSDSKGQDGPTRRTFNGGPRKYNDNRSSGSSGNSSFNNRRFTSSNNNRNVGDNGDNNNSPMSRGPPSLKLQNPMKAQRVVAEPQQSQRGPRNNDDRGGPRGPPRGNDDRAGGQRGPRSNNDDRGQRGGPRVGGPGGQRGPPRAGGSRDGTAVAGGEAGTSSRELEHDSSLDNNNNNQKYRGGGVAGGGGSALGQRERRPKKKVGAPGAEGGEEGRNARKASLRITTGKKGRGAELSQRRGSLKKRDRSKDKQAKADAALERRTVYLSDGPMTVAELADALDEKPVIVIKFLMTDLGVMASMTQSLDPATCIAVVEGFGKIVAGSEDDEFDDDDDDYMDEDSALASGFAFEEDDEADLQPRAPVVTIMGHVDHGKTSLLDAIRNTRVTAGEAGGITQHIAAYQVEHKGQKITFIDTPGHAAFTDMRERGANITDMVILVVAADDGVKQQTADSIACARQAGVPLVVAINKCDLETANPTRVMTELTAYDILTEEFGGEVQSSQISAKEKTNLDDLLDKIMIQAEVQDLKANPNRDAEGIVVEALLERGLGTVATTLVKKGTLKVGDVFVAGETYGRVRALISTSDERTRVDAVGPSTPVRVVGFEGMPAAGDILVVVPDEQTARDLAESRQRLTRERESSFYQDGLMSSVQLAFGSRKQKREMCVVVKGDVQGSAEALTRALRELKLENDEAVVTIKVLVSQTGEVSKSDIAIASVTPGTTVIAFGVPASFAAMEDARALGVNIEYYNIVYDAIESVESRMQEVLSPTPEGEYVGSATVQEVFNIGGTGNIAGSRCTDGYLRKGSNVRVMRGDKILVETKIKSLRNFKSETDNIEEGNECGIGLMDFEDFQPADVIECYVV